jgi:hypothetical protein
MCLPTALALPLHSYGDFGSPVIGSSTATIKRRGPLTGFYGSFRSNSGSLAIFTAIRRASPLVSSLLGLTADELQPRFAHALLVRNGPETQQHQTDDEEREDSR